MRQVVLQIIELKIWIQCAIEYDLTSTSAVHRSRRAGAGAGVLTYFAGAGAGVCSPPVKL